MPQEVEREGYWGLGFVVADGGALPSIKSQSAIPKIELEIIDGWSGERASEQATKQTVYENPSQTEPGVRAVPNCMDSE